MSTHSISSTAALAAALIISAIQSSYPAAISVLACAALVAAVTHAERSKQNEIDEMRSEMKRLHEKIEAVTIARGFGRG